MKHEEIKAVIEEVSFSDLYISEINPREIVSEESIAALAENIRAFGLIQNLAGLRDKTGKVAIVAGGRRLRALEKLQDDARFQSVSVKIAPDLATAEIWASSENHLREKLHAADEIRQFGDMAAKGAGIPEISLAFGVTEQQVQRRLKLAHLPAPVLDALRNDEITISAAAAFTVSQDEKNTLEVLGRVRGGRFNESAIKNMLKPNAISHTHRKAVYVSEKDYAAAGGRITRDLFAENIYFDDADLLDELFTEKLKKEAEAIKTTEGWKWVSTITDAYVGYHHIHDEKFGRLYKEQGVLSDEQTKRYDELLELEENADLDEEGEKELDEIEAFMEGEYSDEQKAVSGIIVYVNNSGTLRTEAGLIHADDKAEAIKAGLLRASSHVADAETPKSPISQKLREDLNRVTLGAKQNALLSDPELLVDLLAYQLSHSLRWENPLGISTNQVDNWPSTEAAGYALDTRLTDNPPRDMWGKDLAKSFRAFRQKGADHIKGELVRFIAAQYRGGDEKLSAMIEKETQPSIRSVWTPNAENIFSRVGGPYLNEVFQDVLGLKDDDPDQVAFSKLKKAEKVKKLDAIFSDTETRNAMGITTEQEEKIATWLPEGMA